MQQVSIRRSAYQRFEIMNLVSESTICIEFHKNSKYNSNRKIEQISPCHVIHSINIRCIMQYDRVLLDSKLCILF